MEIQQIMRDDRIRYEDVVSMTEELRDIVDQEHLTTKLVDMYFGLMNLYFEWADLEGSIKYGEMALKYMEAFGDSDCHPCQRLRANLEWLKRKRDSS